MTLLLADANLDRHVHVDFDPRGVELAPEQQLQATPYVVGDVHKPLDISRELDARLVQNGNARTTEGPDEESELEDDVLTCPRLEVRLLSREARAIIPGEQDDYTWDEYNTELLRRRLKI